MNDDRQKIAEASAMGNWQAFALYLNMSAAECASEFTTPWSLSRFLEAIIESPGVNFEVNGDDINWLFNQASRLPLAGVEQLKQDKIEYLELRSKYLVEFAGYQNSLLGVLEADSSVRPPPVPRVANMLIAFEFIEKEAYEATVSNPYYVFDRVIELQSELLLLQDFEQPDNLLALKNAMGMLRQAGMNPLFPVRDSNDAYEFLNDSFESARTKYPPWSKVGELMIEILRMAFSGTNDGALRWRTAWLRWMDDLQAAQESEVAMNPREISLQRSALLGFLGSAGIDTGGEPHTDDEDVSVRRILNRIMSSGSEKGRFNYDCIMARLPAYAGLLWQEAKTLESMSRDAFAQGALHDGGMVSLAHFRVLEVVYNSLVEKLITLLPNEIEPEEKYWKLLLRREMDGSRPKSGRLMLNELRDFFNKMGGAYGMYLDERKRKQMGHSPWIYIFEQLDSVLTESGRHALLGLTINRVNMFDDEGPEDYANDWSACISGERVRKFRNPPAHTTFARFDIAEECSEYVSVILGRLLGAVDSDGPHEGWIRLHALQS